MASLALATSWVRAEAPPLPSSRYGAVEIHALPAPAGTEVSAWLDGSPVARTVAVGFGEAAVYLLDVPGDRPDTPEIEGPTEGQSFEIRIGGATAASTTWHEGAYESLDISAAAGADLSVAISDGLSTVAPDTELDLLVSATNLGPGTATAARLEAVLPPGALPIAISDEGGAAGPIVSWPPVAIPEGELVSRSVRVRLDPSFPAGIDRLEFAASVAHDGAAGADPNPDNDRAIDSDLLVAAPDLAVALSDGRLTVHPGSTLVYRAVVSNHGSQGASGIELSLQIPEGASFFSASHGGSFGPGLVTWPAFQLAVGDSVERTVTARVPSDLSSAISRLATDATVVDDGSNGPDLDPVDNTASDMDDVAHAPDLAVVAIAADSAVTEPQSLEVSGTVEVEVANRGTLPAPASELAIFSDEDGDGLLDSAVDRLLGTAGHGVLSPDARETVFVDVSGFVRFLGDRIFAMVDAALEVPELDESNNVADDSQSCAVPPTFAPFSPRIERHWPPAGASIYRPSAIDSLSTPIVAQLTDDNGDGVWNDQDVPDLVFVTTDLTYLLEPQVVLRAVRGDTLAPIFDVDGFFPHPTAPTLLSFSGLAAADIDRDGKPEILSTTFGPAAVNYLRRL